MLENMGVSTGVREQMQAVQATLLDEHNVLWRSCEHGVRHPVKTLGATLMLRTHDAGCCEAKCCESWRAR